MRRREKEKEGGNRATDERGEGGEGRRKMQEMMVREWVEGGRAKRDRGGGREKEGPRRGEGERGTEEGEGGRARGTEEGELWEE